MRARWPPRRALVGCAQPGSPPVPIFWYISHFDLEKIKGELSGRSAAISRGTWAGALLPFGGAISSGRGKSSWSSSPTTLSSLGGQSSSTSSTAPSHLKNLVRLLSSIFLLEPQIGTCGWLVVLITSCSWLLYVLFGGRLYVQIHYVIHNPSDLERDYHLWVVTFVLEVTEEVMLQVIMWTWYVFDILMICMLSFSWWCHVNVDYLALHHIWA